MASQQPDNEPSPALDQQPPPPPPTPLPGQHGVKPLAASDPPNLGQGRYIPEGRIGAGGTGIVYLARTRASTGAQPAQNDQNGSSQPNQPGRAGQADVAVKVLHEHVLIDAGRHERFEREARAAQKLTSPFVARIVDFSVLDDPPWLAMDYIAGPTLTAVINQGGPLNQDRQHALALGLAAALVDIHDRRIVHRDLTPNNVLCANHGPTVIDFGIAAAIDLTRITKTGETVGTHAWMAPEQCTDAPATPSIDIHAWGLLIAYAATSHPPYRGDDLAVMITIASAAASNNPQVDYTLLSEPLRPLVRRCLLNDPTQRPTATELLTELLALTTPGDQSASASPTVRDTTDLSSLVASYLRHGWSGMSTKLAGLIEAYDPNEPAEETIVNEIHGTTDTRRLDIYPGSSGETDSALVDRATGLDPPVRLRSVSTLEATDAAPRIEDPIPIPVPIEQVLDGPSLCDGLVGIVPPLVAEDDEVDEPIPVAEPNIESVLVPVPPPATTPEVEVPSLVRGGISHRSGGTRGRRAGVAVIATVALVGAAAAGLSLVERRGGEATVTGQPRPLGPDGAQLGNPSPPSEDSPAPVPEGPGAGGPGPASIEPTLGVGSGPTDASPTTVQPMVTSPGSSPPPSSVPPVPTAVVTTSPISAGSPVIWQSLWGSAQPRADGAVIFDSSGERVVASTAQGRTLSVVVRDLTATDPTGGLLGGVAVCVHVVRDSDNRIRGLCYQYDHGAQHLLLTLVTLTPAGVTYQSELDRQEVPDNNNTPAWWASRHNLSITVTDNSLRAYIDERLVTDIPDIRAAMGRAAATGYPAGDGVAVRTWANTQTTIGAVTVRRP